MNLVETTSGTLSYSLTAMLVALVCAASFELARSGKVNVVTRGGVVAISGLIVALVSPAVVERLSTAPSLALAVVTSAVVLLAGISVVRDPKTRVVGTILSLLAVCAILRVAAWETALTGEDRGIDSVRQVARGLSTAAVAIHAFAVLIAAAWIGTRPSWRGRFFANFAIVLAFGFTWLAARTDVSSTASAILRAALPAAIGLPHPYWLESIAAFLVPASIALAAAALLQKGQPVVVISSIGLSLLSHGSFDVPLHALLATVSAQWAILAMTDTASTQRFAVQQPTSPPEPPMT